MVIKNVLKKHHLRQELNNKWSNGENISAGRLSVSDTKMSLLGSLRQNKKKKKASQYSYKNGQGRKTRHKVKQNVGKKSCSKLQIKTKNVFCFKSLWEFDAGYNHYVSYMEM